MCDARENMTKSVHKEGCKFGTRRNTPVVWRSDKSEQSRAVPFKIVHTGYKCTNGLNKQLLDDVRGRRHQQADDNWCRLIHIQHQSPKMVSCMITFNALCWPGAMLNKNFEVQCWIKTSVDWPRSRGRQVGKRGVKMKTDTEVLAVQFKNNLPHPGLTTDAGGTQKNPTEKGRRGREYTQDAVYFSPMDSTLPNVISGRKPVFRISSVRLPGTRHGEGESMWILCFLWTEKVENEDGGIPECICLQEIKRCREDVFKHYVE